MHRQLLVDVEEHLSLDIEQFQAALRHPPRSIAGIGWHARMVAGKRDPGRRGRPRLHRHPFVESQGLVHGCELVKPVRTQGSDSQA